jgi:hypothetical protein
MLTRPEVDMPSVEPLMASSLFRCIHSTKHAYGYSGKKVCTHCRLVNPLFLK